MYLSPHDHTRIQSYALILDNHVFNFHRKYNNHSHIVILREYFTCTYPLIHKNRNIKVHASLDKHSL